MKLATATAAAVLDQILRSDADWLVDVHVSLIALKASLEPACRDAATSWLAAFGALGAGEVELAIELLGSGGTSWFGADPAAVEDARLFAIDPESLDVLTALARVCRPRDDVDGERAKRTIDAWLSTARATSVRGAR